MQIHVENFINFDVFLSVLIYYKDIVLKLRLIFSSKAHLSKMYSRYLNFELQIYISMHVSIPEMENIQK